MTALTGFEPETFELTCHHANHSTTEHLTIVMNYSIGYNSACEAFFAAYIFIYSNVFASRIVRLLKLVVNTLSSNILTR